MAGSRLAIMLLGAAFLYVAAATTIDPEFASWMAKYNKSYELEDLEYKMNIYQANKVKVQRLNNNARKLGRTTKYAMTKFADMTPTEFESVYMGYKRLSEPTLTKPKVVGVPLPTSFDWRTKKAVTPVKDQGQCGSCWAFSATEGVESAWFLAGNDLVELSPQQVVSCDTVDGGCDGGDLPTAFQYIQQAGMELDSTIPYTSGDSGDNGDCTYDASKVVAHISGFEYATQTLNETEMQEVMIKKGPLSICVDAETWQFYDGGIVTSDCDTDLDHCVQLVGWASQGSTPYWIVRNSWNTDWGISGYIYVERNQDLCGIAMEATYVTI